MPLHLKCDTRLLETSVESMYMCYKDLDKWFAGVHGKRLLKHASRQQY